MIGNDGAAMALRDTGSVFFIEGGYVTTGWRPPKRVRKGLRANDWAAWKATLQYIVARVQEGVDAAAEDES